MPKSSTTFKAFPSTKMTPDELIAWKAHRRATKKMRADLRMRGLPMIVWKDGKTVEVPA